MDKLPYELTRHIGKYLDYNSRVSYNVVIPKEGQYVKKLNSDSHNLKCKVALIRDKLELFNTKSTGIERARVAIQLFKYLATTNDNVLLTHSSLAFRSALLLKINEILDDQTNYGIRGDRETLNDIKLNMVLVTTSLKQKLNDLPFQKNFIQQYIEIS